MVDEGLFGNHGFEHDVHKSLHELEESSHITHHKLDEILENLIDILHKLGKLDLLEKILEKEGAMTKELDDLTAQVAAEEDAVNSAIILINGLAAQLASIANDPAAIEALAVSLKASVASLSAAVVANTPVAPVPPVTP
jgi:hypothetical protein